MKTIKLLLLILFSYLFTEKIQSQDIVEKVLLLYDPLTSDRLVDNELIKENTSGTFGIKGWSSLSPSEGMLKIALDSTSRGEGTLEVTITGLDWNAANLAAGADKKMHFINMFSNPNGDHHAEAGCTSTDALFTLRGGSDESGETPRYGNNFKMLWSSRGAKRTENNLYKEKRNDPPDNWIWHADSTYVFSVRWSRSASLLTVHVNRQELYRLVWSDQQNDLKYIFLGKAADFKSFVGPVFSELKVYRNIIGE